MYVSAQTIDFLAPFGAAPGNPEMTGRQTVRAMAKNAFFPNLKLLISSGVSGWILIRVKVCFFRDKFYI
jgi:hypothetical protein